MALVIKDRVRETTTTTGTGTVSLAGAALGFDSFSVIGDGNTTYYCIANPGTTEWEVGIGTYTLSGTTLARTTVISSSNSNLAVNFSAGTKDVFVTYAASTATLLDDVQTLTNKRITARVNSQTTTASPFAWSSDSYDEQCFTALANALTINADAGTPTDGQRTIFRFKDDGTAQALTWTTGTSKSFREIGVTLPTTTVISKTLYVGCIYNITDSRWDAVAVAQEA
jgi:hypothetical protein